MFTTCIEARIFYRHAPAEIYRLSRAIIPLADHIRAVSIAWDRNRLRKILDGDFFQLDDAAKTRLMLLRAAKHARAHLDDYFPLMRDSLIAGAEELEEAVSSYWQLFFELRNSSIPVE